MLKVLCRKPECREPETRNCKLCQFVQLLFVQMLHHFTNVLCMLQRRDQQSVRGIDHHQAVHSYSSYKLGRSVHIIAFCVQNECARTADDISFNRISLRSEE